MPRRGSNAAMPNSVTEGYAACMLESFTMPPFSRSSVRATSRPTSKRSASEMMTTMVFAEPWHDGSTFQ